MSNDELIFDLSDPSLDNAGEFELIPAGTVLEVYIKDVEYRPFKNGNGTMLVIVLKATDGPYKGRLVWHELAVINRVKPDSTNIPTRMLRDILSGYGMSINHVDIAHLRELVGRQATVTMDVETGKEGYKDKNRVKKFVCMNNGAPVLKPQQAAPSAKKAAVGGAPANPWDA